MLASGRSRLSGCGRCRAADAWACQLRHDAQHVDSKAAGHSRPSPVSGASAGLPTRWPGPYDWTIGDARWDGSSRDARPTREMTMTDAASEAKRQSLRDAFDFATKHFAVLSVAITVFGATMAIIFIAAYLRVFDWRIIWVIEYADVLKVGLIVVAVSSGH
jgi:hypothetical protein